MSGLILMSAPSPGQRRAQAKEDWPGLVGAELGDALGGGAVLFCFCYFYKHLKPHKVKKKLEGKAEVIHWEKW